MKVIENAIIYPNPNNGSFYLGTSNGNLKDIFIYDESGKLICGKKNIKDETLKIDIRDISNGDYNLEITCKDKKHSLKFKKE